VAVDAADPASVRAATDGASTVYFAVQPAYTNWPKGFPPLVEGVLGGLAGTGRRLVVVDNLYMYGPTGGKPIVETLPYAATGRKGRARAAMSTRFLEAHRAGDVAVAIGRASDFFGPGATDTVVGERFFPAIVAGKAAETYGDPDLLHSYTYAPDFARALIELGRHDEALGRAWHVPTAPAVSTRRFVELAAGAAGKPPKMKTLGKLMVRIGGLFIPEAREMLELAYEFEEPFVLDDSAFRKAFGLEPTPLEESLAETVSWWRAREGAAA
jgi:nucleoside-diphosphate-sugar epimerase